MNNREAYNVWADSYDAMQNRTRDIEAQALRASAAGENLDILEIGCGTGKNTEWLVTKAKRLVAVDFSREMLAKAKAKIVAGTVEFRELDLREDWGFALGEFDLITCSLALEHIADLHFVFGQARRVLRIGGRFYIGELHPFKQYQGSKARFDTAEGVLELECFVHHVSDFFTAAQANNFVLLDLREEFDDGDKTKIPRLLTLVFEAAK